MMSDAQRGGRRHSSRLADKEDVPLTNGIGHGYEPVKQMQKTPANGKAGKSAAGVKTGAKRKHGELPIDVHRLSWKFTEDTEGSESRCSFSAKK